MTNFLDRFAGRLADESFSDKSLNDSLSVILLELQEILWKIL